MTPCQDGAIAKEVGHRPLTAEGRVPSPIPVVALSKGMNTQAAGRSAVCVFLP